MSYLTSHETLNDAFNSIAEEVLINGEPQQVVITTAYLGIDEKRHISSLKPFKRGDYVEHNGHTYIVTEEVKTKRHNRYRATMVSCDYAFLVRDYLGREDTGNRDSLGRPIFKDIYSDPYNIWGHMKQWDRSLNQSFQINMMQVTFFIDVQDNEKNREQFKINNTYKIKGRDMTVALHELSNDGLLGLLFVQIGKTAPY